MTLEGVNGANGDITHSLALSGSIPADGIFLAADDAGDGTSLVAGADWIANFDFQNGPDSIVLRNADGIVDAVGYGVFGIGEFFAGEGAAAPDAPADNEPGAALRRRGQRRQRRRLAGAGVPRPPARRRSWSIPEPSTASAVELSAWRCWRRSRGGGPARP